MSTVSLINGHIDRNEKNPQRDKLIELLGKELMDYASWQTEMALVGNYDMPSVEEVIADKILKDGWIKPPCKIGDKVYKVWYTTCHKGETFPDNWSCVGCNDECDMKKTITKMTVPNLKFIVENFMSGYTNDVYFLTEEEALSKLQSSKKTQ